VWVCQEDDGLDIVGNAHNDADIHGTTVCEVVAREGEYDELRSWSVFRFQYVAGI